MVIERTVTAFNVVPPSRYNNTSLLVNDGYGSTQLELSQAEVEEIIEELASAIGYIADLRTPREKFADTEAQKAREELRETPEGYDPGREEPLTDAELAATPYAAILDAAYRNTAGGFA